MSINIEKNSPVLICGMNNNLRALISKSLRKIGYSKVTSSSELRLGLQRMETEDFSWLIIDLRWKDPVNAINLLKLINETPTLSHLKVSLMITPDEIGYVSIAFELGILSIHNPIATENEMHESFLELEELRKKHKEDSRLVSSFYLAKYLKEEGYFQDLIDYYKKLSILYPKDLTVLKSLAEGLVLIEDNEAAHAVLLQITKMDDLLASEIKPFIEVATLGFSEHALQNASPYPDFKKALLLCPAGEKKRQLQEVLEELSIKAIEFDYQNELEPQLKDIDLIFTDWQQTTCPAPYYIDQILDSSFDIPIIGLFPEGTHIPDNFLDYMGFSSCLSLPMSTNSLSKVLTHTTMSKDASGILKLKMIRAALSGKMKKAQIMKSDYFKKKNPPEGEKFLIEAWVCLQNNEFIRAKDYALKAMKVPSNTNQALLLLSKALVADKDYTNAMTCYDKASLPSSQQLASIFELALEKISHLEDSKSLDMHPPLKYGVGLNNSKAICLVHQERVDEGVGIFLGTLGSLGRTKKELSSIVCYNLGMAFARVQLLKEAYDAFEKAKNSESKSRISRCVGYLRQLKECIQEKKEYQLTADPEKLPIENLEGLINLSFSRDETDTCCQYIYKNTQNPLATHFLFDTKLEFKKRLALKREGF